MLRLVKILFLVSLSWAPYEVLAQSPRGDRAEKFIAVLSSEALKLATDDSLTASSRQAKISKLLNDGFDMPWIARFVLGRNWRLASTNQKKEYLRLFKAIIDHTYSKRFTNYSGQKVIVTGHKLGKRKYVFVSSKIFDPKRTNININVNWRLIPFNNSFKIVDVVIEGVSMGVTQRNEYASVLQRNGNNISALLFAMQQNLERLEKPN